VNDQLTADLASLSIERTPPRRRSVWPLIALATVAAVAAGYRRFSADVFKTPVTMTEIALVSPAQSSVELTSTGYLVPQITVDGSSRVSGRIKEVRVHEGDDVKAGDVLFQLDPTDQRNAITTARARVASAHARLDAARAQLAETRQQWERELRLAANGITTQAAADDLGAHVRTLTEQARVTEQDMATAQAETAALTTDLDLFTIRAPISGRVLTKPVGVGVVVSPGQAMVSLADFESLLVETDVPEARLGTVKRGAPCEVVFDAHPTRRFRGEVAAIAPALNRAKGAAVVKVKVLDRDDTVLPEMAARVSFLSKPLDPTLLQEPPKRVVPKSAIAVRNGVNVVFTVEGGRAHAVPAEEPPAHTKIIDAPPEALTDEHPITIKENNVQ
jgi:RND family efflux transporter MFP subunit